MKLTKTKFRQIIREEFKRELYEVEAVGAPPARGLEEKELREAIDEDDIREDIERWTEEVGGMIEVIDVGNADITLDANAEAKLIDALTSAAQSLSTARELIPKRQMQIGPDERNITKSELQEIIRDAIKEENGGWYSDEHETVADRKYADRPSDEDEEEEPLKLGTPEEDPMMRTRGGRGQASRLRKTVMNK